MREYIVRWEHLTSGDQFAGDVWDRESADYIASMLRDSGLVKNVRVVAWRTR